MKRSSGGNGAYHFVGSRKGLLDNDCFVLLVDEPFHPELDFALFLDKVFSGSFEVGLLLGGRDLGRTVDAHC